mmetsp:Transcript_162102/g.519812  ORF Transcript_162102/g.519812 Transcript_162102/m.519812 type:complete len:240 (+) Transcript_162102:1313-2032(+)
MISHKHSRFSGDLTNSLARAGIPTSVINCWVRDGSASRIRSPMRLNKNTALSKTGLASEKSVSAGKKVVQTFQNSGGDFVSVSTSSCARLASVSKTRTEVSSISRIFAPWLAAPAADAPPPPLRSRPASGRPSRHCSMKETTTSLRVSTTLLSSSDSWMTLSTKGLMMSAAGFTKRAGCCMLARAPTEDWGALTALRSCSFTLAVFCFWPSEPLPPPLPPGSEPAAPAVRALTRTSLIC